MKLLKPFNASAVRRDDAAVVVQMTVEVEEAHNQGVISEISQLFDTIVGQIATIKKLNFMS